MDKSRYAYFQLTTYPNLYLLLVVKCEIYNYDYAYIIHRILLTAMYKSEANFGEQSQPSFFNLIVVIFCFTRMLI